MRADYPTLVAYLSAKMAWDMKEQYLAPSPDTAPSQEDTSVEAISEEDASGEDDVVDISDYLPVDQFMQERGE